MNAIITFIKNWTLPLGIVLGVIGFPVLWHLDFLVPYLIFTMLLLTFSKIPLSNLKFSTFHFLMVAVQLVGSVAVYAALRPVNIIIAEAAMVIIMTPTGTATAVVTQKLGGNAASLTSYMILSNLATAITPAFPVHSSNDRRDRLLGSVFLHPAKSFPSPDPAFHHGDGHQAFCSSVGTETGQMAGMGFLSLGHYPYDRYCQNDPHAGYRTE